MKHVHGNLFLTSFHQFGVQSFSKALQSDILTRPLTLDLGSLSLFETSKSIHLIYQYIKVN